MGDNGDKLESYRVCNFYLKGRCMHRDAKDYWVRGDTE